MEAGQHGNNTRTTSQSALLQNRWDNRAFQCLRRRLVDCSGFIFYGENVHDGIEFWHDINPVIRTWLEALITRSNPSAEC